MSDSSENYPAANGFYVKDGEQWKAIVILDDDKVKYSHIAESSPLTQYVENMSFFFRGEGFYPQNLEVFAKQLLYPDMGKKIAFNFTLVEKDGHLLTLSEVIEKDRFVLVQFNPWTLAIVVNPSPDEQMLKVLDRELAEGELSKDNELFYVERISVAFPDNKEADRRYYELEGESDDQFDEEEQQRFDELMKHWQSYQAKDNFVERVDALKYFANCADNFIANYSEGKNIEKAKEMCAQAKEKLAL